MGQVRTIPQVTQDGNQSGQVSLEITYGGKESPFGGIDTSAPPAYIDPRCFTDTDGFFISDNQLCVSSWQLLTLPVLWGGVSGIQFLKAGSFYNSIVGDINYALGLVNEITINGGSQYTYYITSWNYIGGIPNILGNDILVTRIYPFEIPNQAATLTIPVTITHPIGVFTDSGTLALEYAVSGVSGGTVSVPYVPGDTIATVVPAMITALNVASGATGFSAAPSIDGNSIILTATVAGAAGNNLQIADNSTNTTHPLIVPVFYFPIPKNPTWTALKGGNNGTLVPFPFVVTPSISTVDVGGTLYIGNIGAYILKYSGPGKFFISSFYNGYKTLGKFAGSLIGLGTIAGSGTVDNADMIFSWTAANNLDEWNPVTATGLVTGAGFTQLDDIGDRLTGLIVSNSTAFILRSQGVSYATSLGSGSLPFSFGHIGLGQEGEGAQNSLLYCQYNHTGAFVGNSNVFKVDQGVVEIGDKIVSNLITALSTTTGPIGAASCQVSIGGRFCVVAVFLVGDTVYLFNVDNGTWMQYSYPGLPVDTVVSLTVFSGFDSANAVEKQTYLSLVAYSPSGNSIVAYSLEEGINGLTTLPQLAQLTFPQEELLFGRDVVINAIYFSMNADVGFNTSISFFFNNILFATYNLSPSFWNSLEGNPIEVAIYPTTTGVFTSRSPQLSIKIGTRLGASVRISKLQIYGSMEPEQRPVS